MNANRDKLVEAIGEVINYFHGELSKEQWSIGQIQELAEKIAERLMEMEQKPKDKPRMMVYGSDTVPHEENSSCKIYGCVPIGDKPVCPKCGGLEFVEKNQHGDWKKCDCQANKDIRELDLDNKAIIHNVHTLAKKINELVRAVNAIKGEHK